MTDTPVAAAPVPTDADVPPESGRRALLPLAVLSALVGGVLLGGSSLGPVGLLVAVALAQAVLIGSWVLGTGLPGRIGGIVLGLAAAGATDAVVSRWHDQGYGPVLGVLGVAIPVMFVHQLTRGVVRSRVVESLADITVLLVAVTAIAGFLLLRHQANGDVTTPAMLGALTVGLVLAHLTDLALPALRFDPEVNRGLPAVVVGLAGGGVVGLLALDRVIDFTGGRGAFAGAAVAAVGCLLSIGAAFAGHHSTLSDASLVSDDDVLARRPGVVALQPVAAVLMTFALAGPAAYVLVNALAA